MIHSSGRFVDLSRICPSAATATRTQELGTGDIQVTLRWSTPDDLDLAVTDPSNNTVTFFNPNIPSGGKLDVDANAGCDSLSPTPIENIFWPTGGAPQGSFKIGVNLYTRCQGSGPIPFVITLLVQGNTQELRGTVSEQNPLVTFPFSLPAQAQPQPGQTPPRQPRR